jgi:hypothetical protein
MKSTSAARALTAGDHGPVGAGKCGGMIRSAIAATLRPAARDGNGGTPKSFGGFPATPTA